MITGRITSLFGNRVHPITKETEFHNGIDVSAPTGTPIFSPVDGWVKEMYNHPTGGETLIISDDQLRVRIGLCHLNDKRIVRVGDKITKGQLIAESGNTGASTGPHLHFTFKSNGRWNGNTYFGGDFLNPLVSLYITL